MRRIVAILGLALLLAHPSKANAQSPDPQGPVPGFAYSTNYEGLPQGSALRVRALDNSPTNQRVVRVLRETLARTSTPASDASRYLLNLETEVNPLGAGFPRDRRDIDPQGHYYQFNVPLGRRATDPQPPTARQAAPTPQGSVQFVMTLTVDDSGGRRYWLGQAYYTGSPDDQDAAFNFMARTLVEQLGRTVRQRSFRLQ
jgi:hypothetical protein